ncbi:hypothetical protein ZWY2020_015729 [Hordeum vulgare]|nr:hypothetical protein ZWY2020_015729 [Hordeum vulgare]
MPASSAAQTHGRCPDALHAPHSPPRKRQNATPAHRKTITPHAHTAPWSRSRTPLGHRCPSPFSSTGAPLLLPPSPIAPHELGVGNEHMLNAVPLGHRDSTTANLNEANSDLPGPSSNLDPAFAKKQLSPRDLTTLSGTHTICFSQCLNFHNHIYNGTNIDPAFAALRKRACPVQTPNGDTNLAPLDVQTPLFFDSAYFRNLVSNRGLLNSDQVLFNGGSQDSLVRQYATNPALFVSDFVTAMIKMSSLSPPRGTPTQIWRNDRVVNS